MAVNGADFDLYSWVALPLLIFCARVLAESLGSIRIILVSKGMKVVAPIIGFFEILTWLMAVTQIMQNLTVFGYYIVYAIGFACGTYLGIYIENKMALGVVCIRIITKHDASQTIKQLKRHKYGITTVDAQGSTGNVKVIYSIVKRSELPKIEDIIKKHNPNAFYTIEDVRVVQKGIFPHQKRYPIYSPAKYIRALKKGR